MQVIQLKSLYKNIAKTLQTKSLKKSIKYQDMTWYSTDDIQSIRGKE